MATAKKRDVALWYADKRIGTCYKLKATPYNAVPRKPSHEEWYWVKPHKALAAEEVQLGRGLAKTREGAYSFLIGSLNDDLEKIMWNIRRAASEI